MKQNLNLPVKPIPGSYGIPFIGPIIDRLNFFYHQGQDNFFAAKVEKHNSTVIRTNVPPGSFISSNPRVIALLDAASFPILFDNSKVEKRDVLVGTYMPSTSFTGGHRVCAYLDTQEHSHRALKTFFLNCLRERRDLFIPLFRTAISQSFVQLDDQFYAESTANFNEAVDPPTFNFFFRLFSDNKDPLETSVGSEGSKLVDTWLALQFLPLATLRLPKFLNYIEDVLFHTVMYPSSLVQSSYDKLYNAFSSSASKLLEEAEKSGINRDEACHNLVFMAGFNAYGGFKIQFPILMKWVGLGGEKLHNEIAEEVRRIVKEEGGRVTIGALERMSLVKSVVYEAMRIEPAIPYQLGKAREDMVVSSHDASFEIKKGETLYGYQPFATRDSRIFENAEEFVARRFIGEEGEKLLRYVVWSNERGTEDPSPENKQCTGKNLVVLLCRMLLVEFFLRYDTFQFSYKMTAFAPDITITSLTKAST